MVFGDPFYRLLSLRTFILCCNLYYVQLKLTMAKVMSRFMNNMKSTCFMAWKLHLRTVKNGSEAIRARYRMQLMER